APGGAEPFVDAVFICGTVPVLVAAAVILAGAALIASSNAAISSGRSGSAAPDSLTAPSSTLWKLLPAPASEQATLEEAQRRRCYGQLHPDVFPQTDCG